MEALFRDEARGALRLEAAVDALHLGHVETAAERSGINTRPFVLPSAKHARGSTDHDSPPPIGNQVILKTISD